MNAHKNSVNTGSIAYSQASTKSHTNIHSKLNSNTSRSLAKFFTFEYEKRESSTCKNNGGAYLTNYLARQKSSKDFRLNLITSASERKSKELVKKNRKGAATSMCSQSRVTSVESQPKRNPHVINSHDSKNFRKELLRPSVAVDSRKDDSPIFNYQISETINSEKKNQRSLTILDSSLRKGNDKSNFNFPQPSSQVTKTNFYVPKNEIRKSFREFEARSEKYRIEKNMCNFIKDRLNASVKPRRLGETTNSQTSFKPLFNVCNSLGKSAESKLEANLRINPTVKKQSHIKTLMEWNKMNKEKKQLRKQIELNYEAEQCTFRPLI